MNSQVTTLITGRNTRMLQSEDVVASVPLDQTIGSCVTKDFQFVHGRKEDMMLLNYLQRPVLIYTGRIRPTDDVGESIYYDAVTPRNFVYQDFSTNYMITDPPNMFDSTPLHYMSRLFLSWRGGIKYHIAFVASKFHSCRVRILYNPWPAINPDIPTDFDGNHGLNIVLDVTEETEYSFVVPYSQMTEWSELPDGAPMIWRLGGDYRLRCNGVLSIELITQLVSAAETTSNIYFQIFASAAPDFEFARPSLFNISERGTIANQRPPGRRLIETQSFDGRNVGMSGVIQSTRHKVLPSCSQSTLMQQEYVAIGGVSIGHCNPQSHMANRVTSIRELCNMGGKIFTCIVTGKQIGRAHV